MKERGILTIEEGLELERKHYPRKLELFIYRPVDGGYDLYIMPSPKLPEYAGKHFKQLDDLLSYLVTLVKRYFGKEE